MLLVESPKDDWSYKERFKTLVWTEVIKGIVVLAQGPRQVRYMMPWTVAEGGGPSDLLLSKLALGTYFANGQKMMILSIVNG